MSQKATIHPLPHAPSLEGVVSPDAEHVRRREAWLEYVRVVARLAARAYVEDERRRPASPDLEDS